MWPIVLYIIVFVIVYLYLVRLYKNLKLARGMVFTAWSQVDAALKQRHNLVHNLVKIVEGYFFHKKNIIDDVINTNTIASGVCSSLKKRQRVENDLTQAIKSLFVIAEACPALRDNKEFLELKEQLGEIEKTIDSARGDFNKSVFEYNKSLKEFPASLIAPNLKFYPILSFKVEKTGQLMSE